MATTKANFGTSTAITCTLASLASSTTAGRGCAAVDNTANLFESIALTLGVKTSSSAMASDKSCYVYIYGTEDGTNYNASSAESVGTDAAVTIEYPTNMAGPYILSCPAVSTTYRMVIDVVLALGFIPRKWGFVIRNYTGQNLDATEGSHQKTYTGIGRTISS